MERDAEPTTTFATVYGSLCLWGRNLMARGDRDEAAAMLAGACLKVAATLARTHAQNEASFLDLARAAWRQDAVEEVAAAGGVQ